MSAGLHSYISIATERRLMDFTDLIAQPQATDSERSMIGCPRKVMLVVKWFSDELRVSDLAKNTWLIGYSPFGLYSLFTFYERIQ